jgi:UDP-3-O-[3-hydroxymyristoyl] glucosamine N-acyltransferase
MPENVTVHGSAIVSDLAEISDGAIIGAFAVIGQARIGAGAIIHPHVVIADGVTIGEATEVFPGAFIGKEPKGAGATARTPVFDPAIVIGANCSIGPHAVIYYDVVIGTNCLIGDGASIRELCRIGDRCIISRYVTINYATSIGNDVKVMDLTHLTGNMTIEDGAFVSTLVATMNDNQIRAGYGGHIVGPTIGRDATVGGGSILNPGVSIGAGATVGSGALVTKNVPEQETWTGVPARPRALR